MKGSQYLTEKDDTPHKQKFKTKSNGTNKQRKDNKKRSDVNRKRNRTFKRVS